MILPFSFCQLSFKLQACNQSNPNCLFSLLTCGCYCSYLILKDEMDIEKSVATALKFPWRDPQTQYFHAICWVRNIFTRCHMIHNFLIRILNFFNTIFFVFKLFFIFNFKKLDKIILLFLYITEKNIYRCLILIFKIKFIYVLNKIK